MSQERIHPLIVAGLHLAAGVFIFWSVSFLWYAASQFAPYFEGTFIPPLITMFGRPIAIFILAISGLEIVASIAFARGRRWSRVVLAGFSMLQIFLFPVGTAVSAYTLWVIFVRHPYKPPLPVSTIGDHAGLRQEKPASISH